LLDRIEHAAKIEPVQHQPDKHLPDRLSPCGAPMPPDFDDQQEQHDHADKAHEQHEERLDIGQAVFGADKAGAP